MKASSKTFNPSNQSVIIISFLLLAILISLVYWLMPLGFGETDFVQYWTAVNLASRGQNPYDTKLITDLQSSLGVKYYPILMWNPPFIMPLFWWNVFLSFRAAKVVWFVASVGIIVFSIRQCGFKPAELLKSPLTLIFICSFYPIFLMFYYGQISCLLMLGWLIFIELARQNKKLKIDDSQFKHNEKLGGFFLCLTSIKFHLLWLVYWNIIIRSLGLKKFNTMIGFLFGSSLLIGISLFLAPNSYSQYLMAWSNKQLSWKTPTIGSWLQDLTGLGYLVTRGVPPIIIALIYYFETKKVQKEDDNFVYTNLILLPISLIFSPYGWVYDYCLLLPGCLFVFKYGAQASKYILIAANILMSIVPLLYSGKIGQQYMIWYPVLVFLALKISKHPLLRAL